MQLFMYGVVLACMSYAMVMVIVYATDAARVRAARKRKEEVRKILENISK